MESAHQRLREPQCRNVDEEADGEAERAEVPGVGAAPLPVEDAAGPAHATLLFGGVPLAAATPDLAEEPLVALVARGDAHRRLEVGGRQRRERLVAAHAALHLARDRHAGHQRRHAGDDGGGAGVRLVLALQLGELGDRAVRQAERLVRLRINRLALGDGREIVVDPALRELSLGDWEGRLVADLRGETPERIEAWYRKPSSVTIPGADDLAQFRARAVETMDRILAAHEDADVAVVTHGGFICSWLTWALGMSVDDIWSFSLPNASITTVVLDFKPRLRAFGDTAHLDAPSIGLDGMPSPL
ncbi:MAG: histidine phosphatase family protein [Candidatus Latescibacterota bacterium]|nr:MAG: histidine phosphatase family protein [Candidatus Latescibacterota bacterium]